MCNNNIIGFVKFHKKEKQFKQLGFIKVVYTPNEKLIKVLYSLKKDEIVLEWKPGQIGTQSTDRSKYLTVTLTILATL